VLPDYGMLVYLEVQIQCWKTGVGLDTRRERGYIDVCSFVVFNIDLCLKGMIGDWSGGILVACHMMELCQERSALDGLEDFSVRVIVIGNCPGWVEDLTGVHHFKLLDKSKVVAVSLDGWLGGNWSCGSEVNIPL